MPLRTTRPDWLLCVPRSEREPHGQLSLEVRAGARDAAEDWRQRIPDSAASELRLQVLRVEQVEPLSEQLHFRAGEGERLAQSRVDDADSGAVDLRLADGRETVQRAPRVDGGKIEIPAPGIARGARHEIGV